MRKNSFLYGTIVLILVNFIVRFLGFSYKIILSRMIGPEGIGLFHLVFPILMTLITFTSAGIPVAVSKLVAYHLSLNNKRDCNKTLGLSLVIGLFISIFLSFFLFSNAKFISNSIIKNHNVYYCLVALTPAIPLITLSSIFRGYYYGIKDVGPPGVAQVLEQIFRILFVIGGIYLLAPIKAQYSAMIAVIGISIGEFAGLLWLLLKFKFREALRFRRTYHIFREDSKGILGKIFYISIPITISRLIGVIMQSVNAVLIPQRLQLAGHTPQESLATFGKLAGMALPILFLPFIVTSALVVNIIPTISQELAQKNWQDISTKASIAIKMTILVAIPATALFAFFAIPICDFFYKQADVGKYLSLLACSTVFLSLYHTASGILHGMGKQVVTTINYLLGMSIQLLCTYYLVANPKFGANGFIIGFILSTFIICILNVTSLHRFVQLEIHFIDAIIKPIAATVIMIFLVVNTYNFSLSFFKQKSLSIIISMFIGFISYAAMVILSGGISLQTLKYIFKK